MARTLEEIENDYRKLAYGTCAECGKDFNYGESGYTLAKFTCYSSQGQPDTFEKDRVKLHETCIVRYADLHLGW